MEDLGKYLASEEYAQKELERAHKIAAEAGVVIQIDPESYMGREIFKQSQQIIKQSREIIEFRIEIKELKKMTAELIELAAGKVKSAN